LNEADIEDVDEGEGEGVLFTNVNPEEWYKEYGWVKKYITKRCVFEETDDLIDNFLRNIQVIS